MLAFDITRLQKPVDPDADSMGPDKPMRRDMMPPLGRKYITNIVSCTHHASSCKI